MNRTFSISIENNLKWNKLDYSIYGFQQIFINKHFNTMEK